MVHFKNWTPSVQNGVFYFEQWDQSMVDELEALYFSEDAMVIMEKSSSIAKAYLKKLPHQLGIVCGPISTGKYSVEKNLEIFNQTVVEISNRMPIFNQMPFEPLFAKVHDLIKDNKELCPNNKTSKFFIDHFYEGIFYSSKEWRPHFIAGWEHSIGAAMEHAIFTKLKSEIVYLSEDFV
jgi:hypothetical protein